MSDQTVNLKNLWRLAFFAIAATLFLISSTNLMAQHPASIVTQEPETDEQRDHLPYRVYAQWAIETFDKNRDGSLTKDEMIEMRSPLVEDRFDLDENGKLSFDEVVAAVSRPSSDKVDQPKFPLRITKEADSKYRKYATALLERYDIDNDGELSQDETHKMRRPPAPDYDVDGNQKISLEEMIAGLSSSRRAEERSVKTPTIIVQPGFDLDSTKLAERFFEASLKKNDKNGDRKLDAEEIANASWSIPKWQASDSNSDGELDQDELRVRYQLMFAKLLAENAKTDATMAARKAKPVASSLAANSLSNAPLLRNALSNGLSNGLADNLTKPTKHSTNVVDVKLFLIRLPLNSTTRQMAEAVEMLKSSEKSLDSAVTDLTVQLGVKDYDQIFLSARDEHEVSIQSGGMERQATGITRSTRGTTTNFQNVDVGLIAQLTPKIESGNVAIDLAIQKSDLVHLETAEGETPNDQILNWSYESVVQIDNNTPAIVASSSAGHHWILAIDARIR